MKKSKTILPSKMYGLEKKTENTKRGNLLNANQLLLPILRQSYFHNHNFMKQKERSPIFGVFFFLETQKDILS